MVSHHRHHRHHHRHRRHRRHRRHCHRHQSSTNHHGHPRPRVEGQRQRYSIRYQRDPPASVWTTEIRQSSSAVRNSLLLPPSCRRRRLHRQLLDAENETEREVRIVSFLSGPACPPIPSATCLACQGGREEGTGDAYCGRHGEHWQVRVWVCVLSVIFILRHAARRAMAAAVVTLRISPAPDPHPTILRTATS